MPYDFKAHIARLARYTSVAPSIDIIQGTGNDEERACPCGKTFKTLSRPVENHARDCPVVLSMLAAVELLREKA